MLINKSIIEARAYEAINSDINDKDYQKLRNDAFEAQNRIKELIPDDRQDQFFKIFIDFENAIIQTGFIENEEMYKQGFNDGLEIAARLLKINM